MPGHELVDMTVGPAGGDALQSKSQPGVQIDAFELGGREAWRGWPMCDRRHRSRRTTRPRA